MPGPYPNPDFMEKIEEIIHSILMDQSKENNSNQEE